MFLIRFLFVARFFSLIAAVAVSPAIAGSGPKGHDHGGGEKKTESLQDTHRNHSHEQEFEAMKMMSPAQRQQAIKSVENVGLVIPEMNSRKGRDLFVQKGCVVCHAVNDVGGDIGPSLNAADMPKRMNAFEFAARMWRGATAMVALQEEILGEAVHLTGQELADLVAFAHDATEQKKLAKNQIPQRFHKVMAH